MGGELNSGYGEVLFYDFDSGFVVVINSVGDHGHFFSGVFDFFKNGVDGGEDIVSMLLVFFI